MAGRRQVRNGEPTNDLVFSAYVDNNADVFPHILNLYVPAGSTVADVTFGKGVFWRNVPADRYILRPSDLEDGVDCRGLPYGDASIDCVVLDPPYMHTPGGTAHTSQSAFEEHYRNNGSGNNTEKKYNEAVLVLQRRFLHLVTFGQFLAGNRFAEGKTTKLSSAWAGRHEEVLKGPFLRTVVVILELYKEAGREASRVLRERGVFIVKCQDEVCSNRQRFTHVEIIQVYEEFGFVAEDLFVVVRQNRPGVSSAVRQVHARKNHSYFLVFWKRTVGCALWEFPE